MTQPVCNRIVPRSLILAETLMTLSRTAHIALNLAIWILFLLAMIGSFVWEGTSLGGMLLMIAVAATPVGWIELPSAQPAPPRQEHCK